MTIENSIAEMLQKKLTDGSIEAIIEEKLTKCIGECMENMFRWSGPAKELIEEKLKATMIPAIEKHDFSEYTLKLDAVLTEIVNSTSLQDNKKILDNFKSLMIEGDKELNLSDIFEKWCDYVAENVETSGLDINYDDGVSYEDVHVEMSVEKVKNCSRYSPDKKIVRFTCEHDEDMNLQFEIYKYDFMKGYEISGHGIVNINNLSRMDDMQIFLVKLSRNSTKINIDDEYLEDDVSPEKEPEATFS
ncbi:MAG: hypothetical protein E6600_04605 [Anaerocolumna aminovalerica]|uniref:hypothetical protein n=1 Tax=Anaerocolumna aminovalerica TaxID=1527 RepID=UPI002913D4B5|nr:hypothetical protein [Anaerocolumna aminovalerica]MDU6263763.1 hypothetical protein [Anaerocolumna aminovalerica]